MTTFDDARAAHPSLAFSLYALTPGEGVTLEIIGPSGDVFSFTGPTQQAVLDLAFPPEPIVTVAAGNAFD